MPEATWTVSAAPAFLTPARIVLQACAGVLQVAVSCPVAALTYVSAAEAPDARASEPQTVAEERTRRALLITVARVAWSAAARLSDGGNPGRHDVPAWARLVSNQRPL